MGDLFAQGEDRGRAPLAERMRPRTLDEFVGQAHLLGPGRPLRRMIEAGRVRSLVLWGPPGLLAGFVVEGRPALEGVLDVFKRDLVALTEVGGQLQEVQGA